ncbi:MAG: sensor histidine kinase, partial [Planctomycetota bacterium JB042]
GRSIAARIFALLFPPLFLMLGGVLSALYFRLAEEEYRRLEGNERARVRTAVLALDVPAERRLDRLRALAEASDARLLLLDAEGSVLEEAGEGGPLPPLPAALGTDREQVRDLTGLFTRHGPSPAGEEARAPWSVVSVLTAERLEQCVRPIWRGLGLLLALLGSIGGIGIWILARLASERDHARRRALQKERLLAIGEAMTALAHESRNALQRSQACIEMLLRRVKDVKGVPPLVARLQEAQDDLHKLYERVRSYAAPVPLERTLVDVRRLVHDVWESLAPIRRDRAAMLRVLGDDVDAHGVVDPLGIRQVIGNVFENALSPEHDTAGPDRERVDVRVRFAETQIDGRPALEITIRDNGPGLSDEQRRHIFDPFFTTKSRGTGLGMAITRRILEQHGGGIRVGPDRGAGAEFVIVLPRFPA